MKPTNILASLFRCQSHVAIWFWFNRRTKVAIYRCIVLFMAKVHILILRSGELHRIPHRLQIKFVWHPFWRHRFYNTECVLSVNSILYRILRFEMWWRVFFTKTYIAICNRFCFLFVFIGFFVQILFCFCVHKNGERCKSDILFIDYPLNGFYLFIIKKRFNKTATVFNIFFLQQSYNFSSNSFYIFLRKKTKSHLTWFIQLELCATPFYTC